MNNMTQLALFEKSPKVAQHDKKVFSDPSFSLNRQVPIHRWIPWIAGFSGNFVREIIANELSAPGVVLDPFSGVGTTLVEGLLAGHDVVGFEINPYASLASQVKTHTLFIEKIEITKLKNGLQAFYKEKIETDYVPISQPPSGFNTKKEFYSAAVLRKVLIIQDYIDTIKTNNAVRDVLRVAFAATMIRYSNYSYEPSLGTRSAAGKKDIEDFPVIDAVISKIEEIEEDLIWLGKHPIPGAPNSRVVNDSFFNCKEHIEQEAVDIVITSPPYLNNYHYIRNTRPHLYWLGFANQPSDTKTLEQQNFGKYWQTVRSEKCVELDFAKPPSELVSQISMLREANTEGKTYGGNGWANYAVSYFNDCYQFAQGLKYSLKPNGHAYVVIGNSILQGHMIPTDLYLGQIAEQAGLELIDIHIPRSTRVGNSIVQSDIRVGKTKKSNKLYEAVVELRQPR